MTLRSLLSYLLFLLLYLLSFLLTQSPVLYIRSSFYDTRGYGDTSILLSAFITLSSPLSIMFSYIIYLFFSSSLILYTALTMVLIAGYTTSWGQPPVYSLKYIYVGSQSRSLFLLFIPFYYLVIKLKCTSNFVTYIV